MAAGRLSQPGCFTNTGSSARSGRSLVKLEELLPENNWNRERRNWRSSIAPMRGSATKRITKRKNKRYLLGRRSSVLEFSARPVQFDFKTQKEGVQFAVKKFRTLCASSSKTAVEVLAQFKEQYPHLLVNRLHSGRGHVPGIEVGDCFESRAELSLVGLHRRSQAGIDWKVIELNGRSFSVALCVVVSGGYEDDVDEGEFLIYTGEGGNDSQRTKMQCEDQKLERGNLAMSNSQHLRNSVRVIRGRPDPNSPSKNLLYSYDGLYKVVDCKMELGIRNFSVFKFTLVREGGQRPLLWQYPVSYRRKVVRGFESHIRT